MIRCAPPATTAPTTTTDGFTDFPDDPGCGSEFDDDEANEPPLPQCADGVDNDRTAGRPEPIPAARAGRSPRVRIPTWRPICADGLDNDADGVIDFPNEPGCARRGGRRRVRPAQCAAACGNGLDDDADGISPTTPKIRAAPAWVIATRPIRRCCPPASDGVDNDRDGRHRLPRRRRLHLAADGLQRARQPAATSTTPPAWSRGGSGGGHQRGVFESEGTCGGRGSPEVAFRLPGQPRRRGPRDHHRPRGNRSRPPPFMCAAPPASMSTPRWAATARSGGTRPAHPGGRSPGPGDYYISCRRRDWRRWPFVQIRSTSGPWPECLNRLDDDDDGRTDYPAEPGLRRARRSRPSGSRRAAGVLRRRGQRRRRAGGLPPRHRAASARAPARGGRVGRASASRSSPSGLRAG
jgi:hypothetical protein